MNANQRIWGGALLCLGLGLGATACGSSSAGTGAAAPSGTGAAAPAATAAATPAGADPLAGKSVAQIVALIHTDMVGLKTVHTVAHGTSDGQPLATDFHEALGRCYGTLNMRGGTIGLIVDGSKAWMKMDDASLKAMGLGAASTTLHGRYIAASTTGGFSQIAGMCDLTKTLAQGIKGSTGLTKGPVTTVNGAPVLKITATDGSVILVSDTAHPYLLSVTNTGTDSGTVTFSEFDQPFTVTPPPASQIVHAPGV